MIDVPNKIEQNVLKGVNRDYLSSLNTRQPGALNMLAERMRIGFDSLSENAQTFLEEKIVKYIEEFTPIPKPKPLDLIYPKDNIVADQAALALKPNIK